VEQRVVRSETAVSLSTKEQNNFIKLEFNETKLLAGQIYSIPFKFEAPDGPLSYKGTNLHIDWYLNASVDVAKTVAFVEPKNRKKLSIKAKKGQLVNFGSMYQEPSTPEPLLDPKHVGDFSGILLTLIITSGAIGVNIWRAESFPNRWFWIFLVIGILVVFFQLINYFNNKSLVDIFNRLEFELGSQRVMPGRQLTYKLVIDAKREAKIEEVTVYLKGVEQASEDSRSSRNYSRWETIHEQTVTLCENETIPAGSLLEKQGSLVIPPTVPYTFWSQSSSRNSSSIRVHYKLEFEFKMKGAYTRQEYQIDVVPWLDEDISIEI
ncbi:MAG: hypothetical protein AAF902_26840, partial [Chloroflexota bacterium]